MFKHIMLGIMIAVGSLEYIDYINKDNTINTEENVQGDNIQLDLFYMYSTDEGSYWLDSLAPVENVIFVDFDSLKEWNIDINELHHGNKFLGTFDPSGWDLLKLQYMKGANTHE